MTRIDLDKIIEVKKICIKMQWYSDASKLRELEKKARKNINDQWTENIISNITTDLLKL